MLITIIKNTARLLLPGLIAFGISIQPLQAEESYINESQQILDVIDRWAEAWINLDAETYISYYSKHYRPDNNTSHRAWVTGRKERFSRQKWVKLGISGIAIAKQDGGLYTATFKQRYKSNSFRDSVRKELVFKREQGQWKIIAEKIITP